MKRSLLLLAFLLTSVFGFSQTDIAHSQDHPLIKRLNGFDIIKYGEEKYSSATFINPEDESPVTKNGKKIIIQYKLRNGAPEPNKMVLTGKKGVEELLWYQYKENENSYYYLISKSSEDSRYGYEVKREKIPASRIWVHQEISDESHAYKLTILEEDIINTAEIMKKMDTLMNKGRVELFTIYFKTDKFQFEKESELTINEMVNFLKKETAIKILILGSADSTGGEKHNKELSIKRAQSIRTALIERGIDAGRLRTEGIGESTAMYDPDRERFLQLNRRTTLIKE